MSYTIVGLFNIRNQAQAAIRELTQRGFIPENIDIVNKDGGNSSAVSEEVIITESVGNFLQSLFGNDKRNAAYANAAANTDCIVTIHVDDQERAREVAFVLDKNGAIDIDSAASIQNPENVGKTNHEMTASPGSNHLQESSTIPVIEEQLQIDKRVIETGGIRVKSRIIEKPIEENVRLRNQFVIVNRRSVNREVINDDLSNFREGEIELLELAEVPVISKHARVVEEIEISNQVTEYDEVVHGTLRSTDVEIEQLTSTGEKDDLNNQRKIN